MNENDNTFPDYITFPRTFEKYRWYKPLLVLIVGLIIYIILLALLMVVLGVSYDFNTLASLLSGGYESLNTPLAQYITDLSIIIFIPSIYLASKIVRDRPFSSYSSSRGGWNWKLYLKCLTIPAAIYLIYDVISALIIGQIGPATLTITFLVMCIILVPLQCIAEEYLLRGFVMQTIGSWFKIPILALILQAVIFASMHPYNILGVIGVLIDGIILGFFAWKTNGLEAGSALHTVNNFSVSMTVALGLEVTKSTIPMTEFITTIILTLIAAFALYYIGNKKEWFSEKTSECKLI